MHYLVALQLLLAPGHCVCVCMYVCVCVCVCVPLCMLACLSVLNHNGVHRSHR